MLLGQKHNKELWSLTNQRESQDKHSTGSMLYSRRKSAGGFSFFFFFFFLSKKKKNKHHLLKRLQSYLQTSVKLSLGEMTSPHGSSTEISF